MTTIIVELAYYTLGILDQFPSLPVLDRVDVEGYYGKCAKETDEHLVYT
jgi:hypothetical protein